MLDFAYGTNFTVQLDQDLDSFRTLELLVGSNDLERKGLAKRRMRRLLAPQSQESPIYFHMMNSSSIEFRAVVDQLAEVGFEMVFYSFGSGFDLETSNATEFDQAIADIAYANSKGLEVGSYDLISWTREVPHKMFAAVTNQTMHSACFASSWYDYLLYKVRY